MTEFDTGARRDTGGKGRCDLLPHSSLLRVSRHMEEALEDHEERNWEKGIPMHSFLDSAMRHLFKYMDGWNDEDHLAAAASNVLMAMWTEEHMPDMQDIPSRIPLSTDPLDSVTIYTADGVCMTMLDALPRTSGDLAT